jgi:hypothetical protein
MAGDQYEVSLGLGVPANTPHAISVSLPKWKDNVGYEEGEKRVIEAMVSGYPRFFVHLSIQKVCRLHCSPIFLNLISVISSPVSANRNLVSVTKNVCSSLPGNQQSHVERS